MGKLLSKKITKENKSARPKRTGPKPPTTRQARLLRLIQENLGNKTPRSTYVLMIDAGYSESTAHQFSDVMRGMEQHVQPIVAEMIEVREKAVERMRKLVGRQGFDNARKGVDTLTKNIQLLSGRATERPDNNFSLSDDQFNRLLDQAKKRVTK